MRTKWFKIPRKINLLAASVEDRIVEHLELAELSDELDVAQHLPLRDEARLLFFNLRRKFTLKKIKALIKRKNEMGLFSLHNFCV